MSAPGRPRLPRIRLVLRSLVVLLTAGTLLTLRQFFFANNFGVVDPGFVYRSAQPTHDFQRVIDQYALKSVLNLRGGTEYDPWYVSEVCLAHQNQLAYFDFMMSATRRPSRKELLALLEILDQCPYPLLIHCKWGSDRTGLASALYLLMKRNLSPRDALRCFTITHGHVPLGGPDELHAPLAEYAAWLKAGHLPHTPERFRTWVANSYRDIAYEPNAERRENLKASRIATTRRALGH